MKTFRFYAVVFDNNARAANDLAWVALAIDFAEAGPGTKNLGVTDLDEVDLVLGAKSLDKLDVLGLGASLDENAQMCLTSVESLRTFTETTSESIMNKRVFQDLL